MPKAVSSSRSKNKKSEPIAIIGMAFQFPGDLDNGDSFWQSLIDKESQISELGNKRWQEDKIYHPNPQMVGKTYANKAGLLSDPHLFDAPFFKISPREAMQMDVQQRMMLSLSWHAIEDAGIKANALSNTNTGVYMGVGAPDFGVENFITNVSAVDAQTMLGNTDSIVSNRVSYYFNLKGPSISLDTACSSSLVALHQACLSLKAKETDIALVGGCNIILHPFPFVGFSKASMLSKAGQCRAFDKDGQGYVRAEGGAVLLLKPLKKAINDKNPIHAIIKGSLVNSDGKTTSLPVPSSNAQQQLLETLYHNCGIDVNDIDYFEAHGTGTQVGDPLEANAIGEAISQLRDKPLPIGSVKTNIGHLECGSGMAGLVKIILSIKNKMIAPNLYFDNPNPNIDFDKLKLCVPSESISLKDKKTPLIMGVNSFGFGGTNAHVILEEYIRPSSLISENAKLPLMPPLKITAESIESLKKLATLNLKLIKKNKNAYYNIAYSNQFHRNTLKYSRAFFANDINDFSNQISLFIDEEKPDIYSSYDLTGKLAFVFSGNGCQWAKMGQSLLAAKKPQVLKTLDNIEKNFSKNHQFSVKSLLMDNDANKYDKTENAQTALFALQVIIYEYLKGNGFKPDFVIGHSVGEVAAAYASGALSLKDAIHVIYYRSLAQGKTKGLGKMAALGLSAKKTNELIEQNHLKNKLSIAGINSHQSVTISGDEKALSIIEKHCQDKNLYFKKLELDYPFHSESMQIIQPELIRSLKPIKPKKSKIPFVSTVTGEVFSGESLDENYWWLNIYQPVLFQKGLEYLLNMGGCYFVEIGPHSILKNYIQQTLIQKEKKGLVITSLDKKDDEFKALAKTKEAIYVSGATINEKFWFKAEGEYCRLPSYPFDKKRYCPKKETDSEQYSISSLLGHKIDDSKRCFQKCLSVSALSYLKDHLIDEAVIFPAAAYIEQCLAAIDDKDKKKLSISDFEIHSPLMLSDEVSSLMEINIHNKQIDILSKPEYSNTQWQLFAKALEKSHGFWDEKTIDLDAFINSSNLTINGNDLYQICDFIGLGYKGDFRQIEKVYLNGNKALSFIASHKMDNALIKSHLLYPPILDAAFQMFVAFQLDDKKELATKNMMVPIRIDSLGVDKTKKDISYATCEILKKNNRSVLLNIELYNKKGELAVYAKGVRLKSIPSKKTSKDIANFYFKNKCIESHYQLNRTNERIKNIKRPKISEKVLENQSLIGYLVALAIYEAISFAFDKKKAIGHKDLLTRLNISKHQTYYFDFCLSIVVNEGFIKDKDNQYIDMYDEDLDFKTLWLSILSEGTIHLSLLLMIASIKEHFLDILSSGLSLAKIKNDEKNYYTNSFSFYAQLKKLYNQDSDLERIFYSLMPTDITNDSFNVLYLSEHLISVPDFLKSKNNLWTNLTFAVASDKSYALLKEQVNELNDAFLIKINSIDDDLSLPLNQYHLIILDDILFSKANAFSFLKQLRKYCHSLSSIVTMDLTNTAIEGFCFGGESRWWLTNGASKRLNHDSFLDKNLESFFVSHPISDSKNPLAITWLMPKNLEKAQQNENVKAFIVLAERALSIKQNNQYHLDIINLSLEITPHQLSYNDIEFTKQISRPFDGIIIDCTSYLKGLNCHLTNLITYQCLLLIKSIASKISHQFNLIIVLKKDSNIDELTFNVFKESLSSLLQVITNEINHMTCRLVECDKTSYFKTDLFFENLLLPQQPFFSAILNNKHWQKCLYQKKSEFDVLQSSEVYRLDFSQSGALSNLKFNKKLLESLSNDEVIVETKAVGLNFRDLMYTMGLISDESVEDGFLGASLGMEFSGIIKEKGFNVNQREIGERVLGFSPSSFSNEIKIKANNLLPIPDEWSYEQAASIPTVFFTAFYALTHLARLEEGETLLIHGAAGGVGIAAIQIASLVGANIIATVGSDEKKCFVQMLGVKHVYQSRDLSFVDDIEKNHGKVDVVLNSLSGELLTESVGLLKPFGRFLELGKRDFYANSPLGLRPFRNNISFYGIDLDQLMKEKPQLSQKLFKALMNLFYDKKLIPLPVTTFKHKKVIDAFRYMQQSKQIGKVVVSMDFSKNKKNSNINTSLCNKFDYYLVVGGTKGFGLETALQIKKEGARKILLLSKSGYVSQRDKGLLDSIKNSGCEISILKADVTDYTSLKTTLAPYLNNIRGVIHAAAYYQDVLIENISGKDFNKVYEVKVNGALNLHQLFSGKNLDFFVLYGSVSTLFGNAGQSAYVSANAALIGIIKYRRSLGLPGKVISWGPVSDVGILQDNPNLAKLMHNAGLFAKPARSYLKYLKTAIFDIKINDYYASIDFTSLYQTFPKIDNSLFANFENHFINDFSSEKGELLAHIMSLSTDEKEVYISELICNEISEILKLSEGEVTVDTVFSDIGLDSIMGVELIHVIEKKLQVKIPVMMVTQGQSVRAFSKALINHLAKNNVTEEKYDDHINLLQQQHQLDLSDDSQLKLKEAIYEEIG